MKEVLPYLLVYLGIWWTCLILVTKRISNTALKHYVEFYEKLCLNMSKNLLISVISYANLHIHMIHESWIYIYVFFYLQLSLYGTIYNH